MGGLRPVGRRPAAPVSITRLLQLRRELPPFAKRFLQKKKNQKEKGGRPPKVGQPSPLITKILSGSAGCQPHAICSVRTNYLDTSLV